MKLPATITLQEAAEAHRQLASALAQPPADRSFRIDAGDLTSFDTSALAVLLAARRAAQAQGLSFELQRAPAKLNQLAALYGVSELLGLQAGGM